jgi:hypothetical protein
MKQHFWGGVATKMAVDPISLGEVAALETATRRGVVTLGVPIFVVRLALGPESILKVVSSGFQNRRLRSLAERLAQLRPGLPTVEEYAKH